MATVDPDLYESAGKLWNVDPALLRAVAKTESGEDTAQVGPPTRYGNARGAMQFIAPTGNAYGVTDPHDQTQAVYGAAHYLSDLLQQNNGDVTKALLQYNGSGNDTSAKYAHTVMANYDPSWRTDTGTGPSGNAPPQTTAAASTTPSKPGAATTAPTSGPTAGMSTDDVISGLTAAPAIAPAPPATAPPVAATAAVPTTGPTAGMSTDDVISGLVPSPPPPVVAKPAPVVTPPAAVTGGNALTSQNPPVSTPFQTPAQENFLAGLGQGIKRAIDVPAELLAGGVNLLTGNNLPNQFPNWVPGVGGSGLNATGTRAADLAADTAYQAQYGADPTAAAGFRGGQVLAPLAVGGATTNLLKLAGTAGRFLAGTAAEDVPGILGWAARRLSGATGGAIQGGETTAMTGDPNTPIGERAVPGAVVGAGLGGAVLPTVSSAVNWVANRFGSATTPAAQQIIRAMTRDNMTPGQLDSALTELGPNASLADVGGANLRGLAETAANSPGPAAQQARQYLNARAEGQTQRLNDAVKSTTGAQGSAFDTMEALSDARRTAAAPAYDNFYNNTTVTPDQAAALRPFIADPTGQQALQKGVNIARMESVAQGKTFNPGDYGVTQADDGTATILDPTSATPKMLDAVKRGYDQVLEQYRDPTTGKLVLDPTGNAINNMRAAYVQKMRSTFPQYGDALDAWAGPSQDMDALSLGRRVLGADPDVTANAVSKLSDSQKQMYQVGMAQTLKDRIAATPDDADATRRIFGNDLIRSRIAAGFGGEDTPAFQNFQNTMNNEATFAATRRDILGGSPTARRLAGMADQGQPADVVTPLIHLAHGNVGAAATNVIGQLGDAAGRFATLPADAQQQALGELLFGQGPGAQNRLMQAITPGGAAALRGQLQNALTGYPGVYAGINALSPSQQGSMANMLRNPQQSPPPIGGR